MGADEETPFIDITIRNNAAIKMNRLDPTEKQIENGVVPCIIEVPRGSANKYEYEKSNGMLELDRVLHSCVHYPGDYGFVPNTLCGDGDPIDVLVMNHHTLVPGCVAMCRIIGLMDMVDEKGADAKLLAVLEEDERSSAIHDIADVSPHVLQEIKRFFENYKRLESKPGKNKWAKVEEWHGREYALKELKESRQMHLRAKSGRRPSISNDFGTNESKAAQDVGEMYLPNMYDIPPHDQSPEIVSVFVEVARETANRYIMDKNTGFLTLEKVFDSRLRFPGDFGFIPQTAADGSGNALGALIVNSTSAFVPGTMVDMRVIGCIELKAAGLTETVMIGVTHWDPRLVSKTCMSDLSEITRQEIRHFFDHYKELFTFSPPSRKRVVSSSMGIETISKVIGFQEKEVAYQHIRNAATRYQSPRGGLGSVARLGRLPIGKGFPEVINALVETCRGSMNKYALRDDLGILKLDRVLPWAMYYPTDYGMIPQTHDEDCEPLDIIILTQHSLAVGALVEVRVVAMMTMEDEKGPSAKILAVPASEPRSNEVMDLDDVPAHVRAELKEFFSTYKMGSVTGVRWTRVTGFHHKAAALENMRQAHSRYYVSGRRFEELAEKEKSQAKAYTEKISSLEEKNAELEQRLRDLEILVTSSRK